MEDTGKLASSLSEERRKDVFWGASRQGPGVEDGMGSVSRVRVLTREARGVEDGEDPSSSLIEGGLKIRIPCFGVGVVEWSSGLDPRMVLIED